MLKKISFLKRVRTEEEKVRRHLYGDAGASFSRGREITFDTNGICPAITTFVQKDIPILEVYED